MKKLRSFIGYIILAVNALFAVLFLLSAFSSYINPIEYPVRSCIGLAFPIFLAIVCCFFVFWLFIRARYALLSLVVLLIAYQPIRSYIPFNVSTVEPDNYPIKILSYNTMSLGGAVEKDKESPVIAYMLDSDADIMCLQEYNTPASKRNSNVG